MADTEIRWQPLESNPDVMNKYMSALGVGQDWEFEDICSLDEELLFMVRQPCCALLLLFPISENYSKYCEVVKAKLKAQPQTLSPNVWFMKQTIRNACGTIGLVHCLANNQDKINFEKDSSIKLYFDSTNKSSPEGKGRELEKNESIRDAHKDSAQEGQTREIAAEDEVKHHFIAFVHVDGNVYELDGSKPFPLKHGECNKDTFLLEASKVCKEFMVRDPTEQQFTIVALVKK